MRRIRAVVVDDAGGIAADLNTRVQKSVDSYRDPWLEGRTPVEAGALSAQRIWAVMMAPRGKLPATCTRAVHRFGGGCTDAPPDRD
jgi:hypothetical protein